MKFRIADLNILINGADYPYISNRMKSYSSDFETPDLTFDCVVTTEDIKLPGYNCTEKIERWNWITDNNGSVAVFNIDGESGKVSCLTEWNCEFNGAGIYVYDSCPLSGLSAEKKLFNILGMVMGYTIIRQNGMIFHSSSISYKGEGILFSAPSGTGKSTQANLWKELYPEDVVIFNDDTPIIRKTREGIFAYGTPWSGKTELNTPLKVPIKAIVCVERSKENRVERLSVKDAFFRIFNETKKPAEMKLMNEAIDFISVIAEETEIYRLYCDISDSAVSVLKECLFG